MIAVVDIDAVKRRELETDEARRQTLAILHALREGLVVCDEKLRVRTVNDAFCGMFGMAQSDVVGRAIADLGDGDWNEPRLRALLSSALSDGAPPDDLPVERTFHGVGLKRLVFTARRVEGRDGQPPLAVLAIREA